MKRILLVALVASVPAVWAQQPQSAAHESSTEKRVEKQEENPNEIYWKWANFAMLAAVIGYFAVSKGVPLLNARTAEIQCGIREARAVKQEADGRFRNIEQRLENIKAEIAQIRADAYNEIKRDSERMHHETENLMGRIRANSEQEIASALKGIQTELRIHAAQLALDLAENKIRQRLTPQTQDDLVRAYVSDLDRNAGSFQQKAN